MNCGPESLKSGSATFAVTRVHVCPALTVVSSWRVETCAFQIRGVTTSIASTFGRPGGLTRVQCSPASLLR